MKITWSIVLVILSLSLISETAISAVVGFNCDRDFANQGEMERCGAAQLFHNEYRTKKYPTFAGQVARKGDAFQYGKREMQVTPDTSGGAKRFEFWLWHEGFVNPSVYFIELKTDWHWYFFYYGWMII